MSESAAWHVELHTGPMTEEELEAFLEPLLAMFEDGDVTVSGMKCDCDGGR